MKPTFQWRGNRESGNENQSFRFQLNKYLCRARPSLSSCCMPFLGMRDLWQGGEFCWLSFRMRQRWWQDPAVITLGLSQQDLTVVMYDTGHRNDLPVNYLHCYAVGVHNYTGIRFWGNYGSLYDRMAISIRWIDGGFEPRMLRTTSMEYRFITKNIPTLKVRVVFKILNLKFFCLEWRLPFSV